MMNRSFRALLALPLLPIVFGLPLLLTERPRTSDPAMISGTVEDDRGPIAGAVVRFKGTSRATLTDAAGRFRLASLPGTTRITASKEGYIIGGVSADADPLTLHLRPIPQEDCERYNWVDPSPNPESIGNCANCHGEIHREWQASGHSRSATNPRFLDLYEGTDRHGRRDRGWNLLKEHPDGAGVCASCHGPTLPTAEFDIRAAAQAVPSGLSSVHCDFCHKVVGPEPGKFGLTHGRFQLELRRPDLKKVDQSFFGPLDDVDRGDDIASGFQRNSQFCAACHEGVVFGVPVYTTYSEWLDSPAKQKGQSCQSCHMAPTGKLSNFAPGRGGIERDPKTLGNHRFFAGSRFEMLQRAVRLESHTTEVAEGIAVEVQLTARDVGHRVPTGFIDRQLILLVEADRPLVRGPRLPSSAGKEMMNQPGRVYAKTIRDETGRSPVPFWRADPATLNDTRLKPEQTERTTFVFPPETTTVRVRLWHRRFWSEVAEMKQWPNDDLLVVDRVIRVPLQFEKKGYRAK